MLKISLDRLGYADYSTSKCIALAFTIAEEIESTDPISYAEAIQSKALEKWLIEKESDKGTGQIRYKARIVAKGFSEKEGIDYNDIFSPIVKQTSIRIMMVVAAKFAYEVDQMDVKNSLFACKSKYDPCVYFNDHVYILLYVDDILIIGKQRAEVDKVKMKFSSEFKMKDLGRENKILGIDIVRKRLEYIMLSQIGYLQKVLDHFSMDKAKQVTTPIAPHFKLTSSITTN
uniref:Reverse transcriptase Ty1/copia-type domain-containing protein n=1 Tax=Cannabis sativa TaxID=3483 RepID=A0A803QBP6_CANSA